VELYFWEDGKSESSLRHLVSGANSTGVKRPRRETNHLHLVPRLKLRGVIRRCTQKFPDWPPGAITANGTALCH
jgi:hypothetical protein